jgi:ATP-dependent Lhr-like helicase
MSPQEARQRIVRALPDSALFGAHFRMNAARALLLPRSRGRKRTPFWLQRLKAKDMLALVRGFDDFPLIVETYRECLEDALDLPHLESLLGSILAGEIRISAVDTAVPSPVAAGLLFNFINTYMYEWDAPKAERQLLELSQQAALPASAGEDGGLGTLLRSEAVSEVVGRAGHAAAGRQARSMHELAVFFDQLGDLSVAEALARCGAADDEASGWLRELESAGRIVPLEIAPSGGPELRHLPAELAEIYRAAFGIEPSAKPGIPDAERDAAADSILRRYLGHIGPVSAPDILRRYPFDPRWLTTALGRLEEAHEIVRYASGEPPTYLDRRLFEQARRRTIAILRKEVRPVPPTTYVDFLSRWQHLGRDCHTASAESVSQALAQLRGVSLPGALWEREILPARVSGFSPTDLADAFANTGMVWTAAGTEGRRARAAFFRRGEGRLFLPPPETTGLSGEAQRVYDFLRDEGASPVGDLETGLGLPTPAARAALVELALAGLATSDVIEGLYAVMGFAAPEMGARRDISALAEELAARRTRPAHVVRPKDHRQLRGIRRGVQRKLERELALSAPPSMGDPWAGRWSLLHRAGVMGPAPGEEELALARARVLLERYGLVTREAVSREAEPLEWGAAVWALARMELRGEIRRGYFVSGFWGVQYALPEAVERLRAVAAEITDDPPLVVMNATDPAQVYGLNTTNGPPLDEGSPRIPEEVAPRFTRVPSTHLVFRSGQLALLAEDSGERMWSPAWATEELARRAVAAYLARPGASRRVLVTRWNGQPALGGPAQRVLQPLGFTRAPGGLERWA